MIGPPLVLLRRAARAVLARSDELVDLIRQRLRVASPSRGGPAVPPSKLLRPQQRPSARPRAAVPPRIRPLRAVPRFRRRAPAQPAEHKPRRVLSPLQRYALSRLERRIVAPTGPERVTIERPHPRRQQVLHALHPTPAFLPQPTPRAHIVKVRAAAVTRVRVPYSPYYRLFVPIR